MKELHRKDPASHSDPESCEAGRKDGSEALTREDAGEVLSHEIRKPVMPTPLSEAEGDSPQIDKAREMWESGVVEDRQHARKLHGTELGDPNTLRREMESRSAPRRSQDRSRRWTALGSRSKP